MSVEQGPNVVQTQQVSLSVMERLRKCAMPVTAAIASVAIIAGCGNGNSGASNETVPQTPTEQPQTPTEEPQNPNPNPEDTGLTYDVRGFVEGVHSYFDQHLTNLTLPQSVNLVPSGTQVQTECGTVESSQITACPEGSRIDIGEDYLDYVTQNSGAEGVVIEVSGTYIDYSYGSESVSVEDRYCASGNYLAHLAGLPESPVLAEQGAVNYIEMSQAAGADADLIARIQNGLVAGITDNGSFASCFNG